MPQQLRHRHCKSTRDDTGWGALLLRDLPQGALVRVGKVCPACGVRGEIQERIGAVCPG